jgi:hypothetical protein
VVLRLDLEAARAHELAQRQHREVEEMARQVEVEPGRPTPASLRAREVRHGHDQATARPQDPMRLDQGRARIDEVLEHVPDHDLVEMVRLEARIGEAPRDADLRARIGAARGFGALLHAVDLEAPVGQRAEDHASAATHVEDARARPQRTRQESDVARADEADEPLDRAAELRPGLSVVLVGIEAAQRARVRLGMDAARSAALAYDDAQRLACEREAGSRALAGAHRAGRYALRGSCLEREDGARVEVGVGQGKASVRPRAAGVKGERGG